MKPAPLPKIPVPPGYAKLYAPVPAAAGHALIPGLTVFRRRCGSATGAPGAPLPAVAPVPGTAAPAAALPAPAAGAPSAPALLLRPRQRRLLRRPRQRRCAAGGRGSGRTIGRGSGDPCRDCDDARCSGTGATGCSAACSRPDHGRADLRHSRAREERPPGPAVRTADRADRESAAAAERAEADVHRNHDDDRVDAAACPGR